MHRPIPAALVLALTRELTPDTLMGRWRADIGSYDFSPTEAIVTIARTGERHVLRIRSIEVQRRTIVVNWAEDGAQNSAANRGKGSHTSYGRFTRHSMTQLPEMFDNGTMGPERTFHRCP
ncbi:MAG TPA: hypothetical protein VFB13_12400 [Reyranella sp.]|jgi:hypothetical protein|nr:hypothetical protein [Reyranella sp.]